MIAQTFEEEAAVVKVEEVVDRTEENKSEAEAIAADTKAALEAAEKAEAQRLIKLAEAEAIAADTKAKLCTTAVVLGQKKSLVTCSVLWLLFAGIISYVLAVPITIILFIYPLIPLLLLHASANKITRVYWYFPFLNAIIGMLGVFLL